MNQTGQGKTEETPWNGRHKDRHKIKTTNTSRQTDTR